MVYIIVNFGMLWTFYSFLISGRPILNSALLWTFHLLWIRGRP